MNPNVKTTTPFVFGVTDAGTSLTVVKTLVKENAVTLTNEQVKATFKRIYPAARLPGILSHNAWLCSI